jgi:hypothetical protein
MPHRKGIKPVTYEDAGFVVGESPVVLDVETDLGLCGAMGHIICDGAGDILVAISTDGTTYGGQFTMKSGERESLDHMDINKIKITHSADSAYRVVVF